MVESISYSDISESLKGEIRDDIKASDKLTELWIENKVIWDLSELKNELWFEQQMVDTLYRWEYKNFLKLQYWNTNSNPFDRLWNIKESIILRGIEWNKSIYSNPDLFSKMLYKIGSIDLDLTKNSKIQNIIKWIMDELIYSFFFSTPAMVGNILKNPYGVIKNFANTNVFIKVISNTLSYLSTMGNDIFDANLSSVSWQYMLWKRITEAVLLAYPWSVEDGGGFMSCVCKKIEDPNFLLSMVTNATK